MRFFASAFAAVPFALAAGGAPVPAPLTPGPQPDGAVLLHSQWPIRPAGTQVALGDFPVALAVHPSGRYAAVLHAGWGRHEIRVVDLALGAVIATVPLHETFAGLAFSPDGKCLIASGGSDGVLHRFDFRDGRMAPLPDLAVPGCDSHSVVGGVAVSPKGDAVFATVLFTSHVVRLDLPEGKAAWTAALDPPEEEAVQAPARKSTDQDQPNDIPLPSRLINESDPLDLACDARHHRLYASLWGRSEVAVLDVDTGAVLARWAAGLHPNEVLLSRDGRRLFVSNGGLDRVTVIDTASGAPGEVLRSSGDATDLPGATPDSLALSPDGRILFVANAYLNTVAVFDVSEPGRGRALGFIPTGWFPSSVRTTPDGRRLLVVSARGLAARANPPLAPGQLGVPGARVITVVPGLGLAAMRFPYAGTLYPGSLGMVGLPKTIDAASLRPWTETALSCRPAKPAPAEPGNPVPAVRGGPTPLRYVIYIVKENRTYDEVLGDVKEGNGDPALCLFPEKVTPNIHRLVRQFALLDNFYANAEISASGHEWSMGAYSSEFVEKTWPPNYGHKKGRVPYTGEGRYAAALPALGYLWDRAREAGITYRDYGEFVGGVATASDPSRSNLPALQGHVDPYYRGWNLTFSDLDRVPRFISELRRFEKEGAMPRLQIVRLPNDHTQAAKRGALSPRAMVAQNDLALGRLVDAVTHSRFWPETAILVVEDDAQNGPDHVDAHRTEALVVSPYTRHGAVDSTAYTTCSMLATIEFILGLPPMSEFDDLAAPMRPSFQAKPDFGPYEAVPNEVSLEERNPGGTRAAALSARFDFSQADRVEEQAFNQAVWSAVRGDSSVVPAPVHAAFVRPLPPADDDD